MTRSSCSRNASTTSGDCIVMCSGKGCPIRDRFCRDALQGYAYRGPILASRGEEPQSMEIPCDDGPIVRRNLAKFGGPVGPFFPQFASFFLALADACVDAARSLGLIWPVIDSGQVAEWLKAHAWRACGPHKGLE